MTRDLLTLRANFHINYLPDLLATFKGIFIGRGDGSLGLGEFDVESVVKPAVELDGLLALEDSRTVLLEAAHRAAFHSNNLYFPNLSNLITPESLDSFHKQTMERARNNQQYSLLLSVNNKELMDSNQFLDVISSCDIPIETGNNPNDPTNPNNTNNTNYYEGQGVRMELDNCKSAEFLLAIPVKSGGFNQKNYFTTLILESLIKRSSPTTMATVTSDTSLLTIHFQFKDDQSAAEIKKQMELAVKEIREIPGKVKDEELEWSIGRARFNRAVSIDSRDSRLLTFAHHFAFSGSTGPTVKSETADNSALRDVLKDSLLNVKPTLISRGNYKKLVYYNELF